MRPTTRRFGRRVVLGVVPRASCSLTGQTVLGSFVTSPCASSSPQSASAVAVARRCYTAPTQALQQAWSQDRIRPWMCLKKECRVVNKAVASLCEACGTPKPVLQRWKCLSCKTVNFSGVKLCKQCKAPAAKGVGYWMCADCGENNRVDGLDDNSVCGFCGYDMAPRTAGQEAALRRAAETTEAIRQQQVNFDSVSFREADEQFSDPLDGAESLDRSLHAAPPPPQPPRPQQQQQEAEPRDVVGSSRHLKIPKVTPFVPNASFAAATKHSVLRRRSHLSSAVRTVKDAAQIPPGPPGFDWMCRAATCGHINPGDEENCLSCGAHIKPEPWECLTCGAENHTSRSRCFHCRTPIPVCWSCKACTTATSVYDKACRSCGVQRPPTEPKRIKEIAMGDSSQSPDVTMQRNQGRGEWYCPSCNKLNFSRRTECYGCGEQRPAAQAPVLGEDPLAANGWGSGAASLQPTAEAARLHNNWICTHCQASNFRTRSDCWKCGRASESGNDWSSETAAPHFEHEGFQTGADDRSAEGQMNPQWKVDRDKWTCAKCYTPNYKTRSECFKCGASKTVLMTPHRTKARRPVKL